MKNLNEMTAKELKELAKELKVKNWWSLGKAALIEEIEKIQNESDEDKAAREEELRKEDELFEHYSKNWTKYGPKNDWTSFYKNFKAGKITLIEELSPVEEKQPETDSSASEEAIEETIEEFAGQDSLEEQERDEKQTKEQPKKRGKGKLIEFDGRAMNLNEWAKELGMTRQTLYARLYIQNWDVEKAFTTPGRKAK